MNALSSLDRRGPIKALFSAFCVAVTAVAFYPAAARGDTASSAGKWYRLTVDAVRNGNEVQFSEFYLYDAQGNRLNLSLKAANATDATQLKEGECFQTGLTLWDDGRVERLFDNDMRTKLGGSFVAENNPSVTLRLQNGAADVVAYNFATCGDDVRFGQGRQLTAWTLEFSEDGQTWVEIDKREGFNPPVKDIVMYSDVNFWVGLEPSENSWKTEPSVSPTSWTKGDKAGTISMGEAAYGEVTCNYTQEQLNALELGTYTVVFTVAAKAHEYTRLEKRVMVTVSAEEGRTISNVLLSGTTVTFDLGAAANDVSLWVAGGASDRGENFDDWADADEAKFVKIVAKGDAVLDESVDLATYGLADANAVRLFTRPAYDETLTGLVGGGTGNSVGPYINTGVKPHLANNKVVVEFTPAKSTTDYAQAVVSARDGGSSSTVGNHMNVYFLKENTGSSLGNLRVDYSPDNGANEQIKYANGQSGSRYRVTLDGTVAGGNASLSLENLTSGQAVASANPAKINGETVDTLLLFAERASGTFDNVATSYLTIHAVQIFDSDGVLVHNYVPVTSAADVNTLYDTVEGKLLAVSKVGTGAGNFDAGEVASTVTGALTFSVPVSPRSRTITSVTLAPGGRTCELSFSPAGEGAGKVKVWAVADLADKGTGGTNVWAKVAYAGILAADEDEMTFNVPSDWNWGAETKVMRFLTTPVYDATLTGLRGNRSDVSAGAYIDTGMTPSLSDKLVAELTTSAQSSSDIYEAVFSARNVSSDAPMTAVVCHNSSTSQWKNKVRFDYGNGGSKVVPSNWSGNVKYTVTLDAGAGSVSGLGRVDFDKQSGDAGGTLLLFALRGTDEARNHIGRFTLHSFKWFDSDGELLHDYIPVVSDGVNTLYDTVAGEMLEVSSAGSSVGGFGAEGTPTPVAPLTWSQAVRTRGLILIFGPAD